MRTVQLTKGYQALVDDEDFDRVSQHSWQAMVHKTKGYTTVYAARGGPRVYATPKNMNGIGRRDVIKRDTIYMHRFILGCNEDVDHKDNDGLNNQRYNLRYASVSQNQVNKRKSVGCSSNYKGVTWDKSRKLWKASIGIRKTNQNLGRFLTELNAAQAYNFAVEELYGDFAKYNT